MPRAEEQSGKQHPGDTQFETADADLAQQIPHANDEEEEKRLIVQQELLKSVRCHGIARCKTRVLRVARRREVGKHW